MDKELQIGLIILSTLCVVGIVVYNKWQENKHRRLAEKTFGLKHPDVLLEPHKNEEERLEPGMGQDAAASKVIPRSGRHYVPPIPGVVDERIDCCIRIEAINALSTEKLWEAQQQQFHKADKRLRWFAFDDGCNDWQPLMQSDASEHHWFCAAIQLVDARGAMTGEEFDFFYDGIQQISTKFLAVLADEPSREIILSNAVEIDRFCAAMDVQIGINILARNRPFSGAKIAELAQKQGLVFEKDGHFHAHDPNGCHSFTLGNLESTVPIPTNPAQFSTSALTVFIDVPRVNNGIETFNQMMNIAREFAHKLDGVVVDDNRNAVTEELVDLIRSRIEFLQGQMNEAGFPPGSALSARLFAG